MKSKSMKKWLLILLLGLATSCGSGGDNEVLGDGDDSSSPANPVVVANDLKELRQFILDESFPEQMNGLYSDFVYSVRNTTFRTSNILGGFITGTTSHVSMGQFERFKEKRGDNLYITHEYGNSFDEIKEELVAIIDDTVGHRKVNNCLWEVSLSDYSRYGIDVCQSMVANPVYKYVDLAVSKSEYWLYSFYP